MSGSRDGERTLLLNNGSSMRFQRPSRTTTGRATHLISKETVDLPTQDVLLPTQDGGNCSELKELSLETSRMIKYWKFKEELTVRTRTSDSSKPTVESANNGTSCTLMNGRVNLKKVNSMKDSDSSLKEISTS
jgi:hypothetical protein